MNNRSKNFLKILLVFVIITALIMVLAFFVKNKYEDKYSNPNYVER